jgi:hypothetical protein
MKLLRTVCVWVVSVPTYPFLGKGYRLIRRSPRLYFHIGVTGRVIGGRGK